MNKIAIQGTVEAKPIIIKKSLTYTVKLDVNLPFKDNQIGVVIINNIQYVRRIPLTKKDVIGI